MTNTNNEQTYDDFEELIIIYNPGIKDYEYVWSLTSRYVFDILIRGNGIKKIPDEIFTLPKINVIEIIDTQISEIPNSIGNMNIDLRF